MAAVKTENQEKGGVSAAVKKIMEFMAAIRLFFGDAKESLLEKADSALRRVQYLFVVYVWVSIGLLFIILGLFDLIISQLGVPRGVVYSLGGVFISLVSVIFLQAAKVKKHRR